MFINTGAISWRKNEYLEIEILGAGGQPVMKLPAVVVHHSLRGTGVEFDAVSGEQRRVLRAWLYGGKVDNAVASPARAVA